MKELTSSGAIVLLPVGSDEFIKYIADDCVYIDYHFDLEKLKNM